MRLGSAPFDEDGVATRANVFVEEGILRSYSLGVYSARKLGMKTTGNAGGMHNLTIKPGDKDLTALIKNNGQRIVDYGINGARREFRDRRLFARCWWFLGGKW